MKARSWRIFQATFHYPKARPCLPKAGALGPADMPRGKKTHPCPRILWLDGEISRRSAREREELDQLTVSWIVDLQARFAAGGNVEHSIERVRGNPQNGRLRLERARTPVERANVNFATRLRKIEVSRVVARHVLYAAVVNFRALARLDVDRRDEDLRIPSKLRRNQRSFRIYLELDGQVVNGVVESGLVP